MIGARAAAAEIDELPLTEWRRRTFAIYREVRDASSLQAAHSIWRGQRDELFRGHPSSPLTRADPLRDSGLPYWPYDRRWRYELELVPAISPTNLTVTTAPGETTRLRRLGWVELPAPLEATVDVWWLAQYGGGLFLPLRDGTAGKTSYGGGRYLLDTVKGADLGTKNGRLIIDLNFLYHPSCRYDDSWLCPLAPPGNTITAAVEAGERLDS
jgi:uncharacterized protein (DUF1684 family)